MESGLAQMEYQNHFSGIMLYDPLARDTLYTHNAQKYFTPASNTKILTLFSVLNTLSSHIPVAQYEHLGDTLYIVPRGDPTQLHPYFKDSTLIRFLKGYPNISIQFHHFKDTPFGPGWAWEDFSYTYSPERSPLPLYGNIATIWGDVKPQVQPNIFKDSILPLNKRPSRDRFRNRFYGNPQKGDSLHIPYRTSTALSSQILENLLDRRISNTSASHKLPAPKTLFSVPVDSVLKRMMVESDNFLAEQLLLLVSGEESETLDTNLAIEQMLKGPMASLEQPPRWVDGSGLSRYNLISPASLVHLLNQLYVTIPRDRLFNLFAVGGASGTLQNWYGNKNSPYVYAKSGSLGNNYCLSGYVVCRSGRVLIFSFMNNHFKIPSSRIKEHIQDQLAWIHENF